MISNKGLGEREGEEEKEKVEAIYRREAQMAARGSNSALSLVELDSSGPGKAKKGSTGSEIGLETVGGTESGCCALVGSGATAGRKFIALSRTQTLFTVAQITKPYL